MSRFRLIFGILLIFITLLAYQNCGSGFGNTAPGFDESASTVDAKTAGAPFPYDITVNAISYMSCADVTDSNGYYSYKAIASENKNDYTVNLISPAGISLRSEFTTYMDNNFKGTASKAPESSIQNALMNANLAKNIRLQMAFRKRDEIQNMEFSKIGGNEGIFSYMTENLSQTPIAAHLAKMRNNKFAGVLPGGSNGVKSVTGTLIIPSKDSREVPAGQLSSEQIREMITNNLFLTFGFSPVEEGSAVLGSTNLITPDTKSKLRAYGRGLSLRFGYQVGAGNPYNPALMLTDVIENDLSKSPPVQTANDWACFSYKIVKPEHAAAKCPKQLDLESAFENGNRSNIQVVRKFLTADKWSVNTAMGCVVPLFSGSSSGCYQNKDKEPEYLFETQPCGYGTAKECVHFVSFCRRL